MGVKSENMMAVREIGGKRSGRREVKCVVCQQGHSAYRCTPAPRTRQMIIMQDEVHTEAPYPTDFFFEFIFQIKEKTLLFFFAVFYPSP